MSEITYTPNDVNKPLAAANTRLMIFSIRLRSILSAAIPAGKVRRQKAKNVRVEIAESSSDDAESPFMTQRKAVSWAETALPETKDSQPAAPRVSESVSNSIQMTKVPLGSSRASPLTHGPLQSPVEANWWSKGCGCFVALTSARVGVCPSVTAGVVGVAVGVCVGTGGGVGVEDGVPPLFDSLAIEMPKATTPPNKHRNITSFNILVCFVEKCETKHTQAY
jgi:hypothetical protein